MQNGTTIQCFICLEPYSFQNQPVKLQCQHNFHQKCIDQNSKDCGKKCPLCRAEYNDSQFTINQLILNQIVQKQKMTNIEIQYSNGQDTFMDVISTATVLNEIFTIVKENDVEKNVDNLLLFINEKQYSYNDRYLKLQEINVEENQKIIVKLKYRIIVIFLKDLNGGTITINNCRINDTVGKFGIEVDKKTLIPIQQQRFQCQTKAFNPIDQKSKTLEEIGIQHNGTIYLLGRLKGGNIFIK